MIQELPRSVVEQIAAGEVIVSPRNALKELLENALDAGATKVEVQTADNGFGLLQVKDNGSGIAPEDLPLLCTRFATSKLLEFSDLAHVATLGFRGEALASISHVAHLQVVSKQPSARAATRARYNAGQLLGTEACAGLDGTMVQVENLFYNNPTRRQALDRGRRTEYAAILDIVNRYAIKYRGTFTCKQSRDAQPTVVPDGEPLEKIKGIYGSSTASHLIPIESDASEYGFKASGYISNLTYPHKPVPPIFFVNGRLVESKPLQRGIEQVYAGLGPRTNTFIYLDISISPENVDVNTHPTKQMVTFLFEEEIVQQVASATSRALEALDKSRSYAAQTVLTSTLRVPIENLGPPAPPSSQRYEHKLVRTDPKQTTLAFAKTTSKTQYPPQLSPRKKRPASAVDESLISSDPESQYSEQVTEDLPSEINASLEPTPVNLISISQLKARVNDQASITTTRLLAQHTFIGLVDPQRSLAAIQHDVRLYLADYNVLGHEFFYQTGLLDFANFGTIHLGDGLSIKQLLELAGTTDPVNNSVPEMQVMLQDYFMIKIENRREDLVVTQMPLLLSGYTPSIARLPQFFASLNQVNWHEEVECLDGILHAIAAWCVPVNPTNKELDLIFSGLKTRFAGKKSLNNALVEIASLPGLYRVFERC